MEKKSIRKLTNTFSIGNGGVFQCGSGDCQKVENTQLITYALQDTLSWISSESREYLAFLLDEWFGHLIAYENSSQFICQLNVSTQLKTDD